jgi:CAAX prenyl protease-like protein
MRLDPAALIRVAPFALYMLFVALRPLLAPLLGPALPWSYALQIGAVMLLLAWAMPRCDELWRNVGVSFQSVVLALAAGLVVFLLWIRLDLPWLSFGQDASFDPPMHDGLPDYAWLIIRVFGAAMVVPVMEELFWRSFVMRWIDATDFRAHPPARVSLKAMLLSSLVFGFEHQMWFAGFVAGLVYAWLYRRGSLWLPIIAHAATNLALGLYVVTTGEWKFW